MANNIDIRVRLLDAKKAAADSRRVGDQIDRMGDKAAQAGAQARRGSTGFRAFDKTSNQAGKNTQKSGAALAAGLGRAVAAAGGLYGAARAVGFIGREYTESARVGSETAAVIKSTGGAARVSKRQVEGFAQSLSEKTGIDDETIQSGQNMLLTFKNIRNEAGRGNDVFNQSSRALIDMAAKMGKDPKTAAIQLGKALNDPVKGITALTRVGVTFTDKEKEKIKTLTESGRRMDAQKMILKELNSEFGGVAVARAQPIDKMRVAFANLAEEIGKSVAPTVNKILNFMTGLIGAFRRGTPVTRTLVTTFLTLGPAIAVGVGLFKVLVAMRAMSGAMAALNAVILANPVIAAIAALVALGVAVVVLYKRVTWFRNGVNAVWGAVKTATIATVHALVAAFRFLQPSLRVLWTVFRAVGGFILKTFIGSWRTLFTVLRVAARIWWTIYRPVFKLLWNALKPIASFVGTVLGVQFRVAMVAIRAFGTVFSWVYGRARDFVAKLKPLFTGIKTVLTGLWHPLKQGFLDAINAITSTWNRLASTGLGKKLGMDMVGGTGKPAFQKSVGAKGGAGAGKAVGGLITRAGQTLVGERGPEVVSLPTSARVHPLPSAQPVAAIPGGALNVNIPLIVDGRRIAHAVGRATAAKNNRR